MRTPFVVTVVRQNFKAHCVFVLFEAQLAFTIHTSMEYAGN